MLSLFPRVWGQILDLRKSTRGHFLKKQVVFFNQCKILALILLCSLLFPISSSYCFISKKNVYHKTSLYIKVLWFIVVLIIFYDYSFSCFSGIQQNLHVVLIMDSANMNFIINCESNPALHKKCQVLWMEGWSDSSMKKVCSDLEACSTWCYFHSLSLVLVWTLA